MSHALKVSMFALFLMSSVSAYAWDSIATCQSTDASTTVCVYNLSSGTDWKSIMVSFNPGLKSCDDPTVVHYARQFVQGEVQKLDDSQVLAVQKHGLFGLGKATVLKLDRKTGTGSFSGKYQNSGGIHIGDGGAGAPAEPNGSFNFELKCQ